MGDPVCRVTQGPKENEPKCATFVNGKIGEWLRAAGAIDVQSNVSNEGAMLSVHAVGGTRMGDNPETNVVDKFGFSHEVPNLGILSGSVMPTHGARNPTLTIQALAWRTAEHTVKNWKGIAG